MHNLPTGLPTKDETLIPTLKLLKYNDLIMNPGVLSHIWNFQSKINEMKEKKNYKAGGIINVRFCRLFLVSCFLSNPV